MRRGRKWWPRVAHVVSVSIGGGVCGGASWGDVKTVLIVTAVCCGVDICCEIMVKVNRSVHMPISNRLP